MNPVEQISKPAVPFLKSKLPGLISRATCFAAFALAGLNHFLNPGVYCKIMPSYIPFPVESVYSSGIFELIGAIGLLVPATRKMAVYGLLFLLVAVFPANINMASHPELFPQLPVLFLYIRLPLQGVIMLWVWSCKD